MQNGTLFCTVCGYIVKDALLLKEHYKQDWHIYNQRRKLANKEPVTEEVFRRKLELLNTTKDAVQKGDSHLKSKNQSKNNSHTSKKASQVGKSIQTLPYRPTYCYFDNTVHSSIDECLEYMRVKYSFIIPEKEYISDFQGLVIYLGEKVFEGHICLYCDKAFSSLMAVRDHMISLGHTMMGTHLDVQKEEIERFYDYSSSYKELIPNFKRLNIKSLTGENIALNNKDNEDCSSCEDEWEYIDEDHVENNHELLVDDVLSVYNLKRPEITEFGDLRLPNGKEVVHRSMAYIYKQKITRNNDQLSLKKAAIDNEQMNALNNASVNLPRIRYINKVNIKQNLLLSREIKTKHLKTGVNNNKLQKFFVRQDIIW